MMAAERTAAFEAGVVTNSVEMQRILALPRRTIDLDRVLDCTPLFARDDAPEPRMTLWPIQSACLVEAALADGLFAALSVGAGKTLVSLLLPEALDSEVAVLLVPSHLRDKTLREIDAVYLPQFDLPLNRLHIVSYSQLSSAKSAEILEELAPDLIIADEAHSLAHYRESARGIRFSRYMKQSPHCRFAAMSGTMTRRSILDYAHLLELALRKNSPLPNGYHELQAWAGALDDDADRYRRPGALKRLCQDGEKVRRGYQRRLSDTRGVVLSTDDRPAMGLVIEKLAPELPVEIDEVRRKVLNDWKIGDEEFDSALSLFRVLRQVACGFYYRWAWPGGSPDFEWLEARAAWHRDVRDVLTHARKGLDSPLLVARAAEAGRLRLETWKPWKALRGRYSPHPPVESVWLSEFLIEEAGRWVQAQASEGPAIVWTRHRAVAEKLVERLGLPYYGPGTDASTVKESAIVCSLPSQGEGKNLQWYCRNLFMSPPPSGKTLEQGLGRTHRHGQKADEVYAAWFGHTPENTAAFARAEQDAKYIQETTGSAQRVLIATLI